MSKRLVITEFKIPKVNMDFEKLPKGECSIEVETSVSMMIPKDSTDQRCILDIKTEFISVGNGTIMSVMIRGFIEICDASTTREEKEELIKNEAIPVIYNELRAFIEKLLDSAHIKFLNLPPLENLGS